jgi:hypothetical protein
MSKTAITTARRRRQFRRDPNWQLENSRAGRLEVTEGDKDIIEAIGHHRFLNKAQVCRLFAHRDKTHIGRRLTELFHQGYLDRPPIQLAMRTKNADGVWVRMPMIYSITKRGVEKLGQERAAVLGRGKMSFVNKVNEGGRIFTEHILGIADVNIAVDCALRAYPHLERLSEGLLQSRLSEERRGSLHPWGLKVRGKNGELGVVPDLVFVVGKKDKSKKWSFAVEVDRGHMPVERRSLSQTSIMRKVIAYARAHTQGLFAKEFGWGGYRILFLVPSEDRVVNCVEAVNHHFKSGSVARIFVFGTLNALGGNMFQCEFTDGRGEKVKLIEEKRLIPPIPSVRGLARRRILRSATS